MASTSSSSQVNKKKVVLRSSDGNDFEVDEKVAMESNTIKHMLEDLSDSEAIPLPNVTGKILSKVIEYCKKHVETSKSDDDRFADVELQDWDTDFTKDLIHDQETLFDLILVRIFSSLVNLLLYLLSSICFGFCVDSFDFWGNCTKVVKFLGTLFLFCLALLLRRLGFVR